MTTFASAKLKVQRSYRHINEIQTIFNAFLQSDFCKIHIEEEAGTGEHLVKFDSIAKPPAEMALAIGDAVHNIASSLDHAIVQIFPEESNWLTFPNRAKRDDLVTTKSYRFIEETLPDLAKIILDEIMPYDTGNVSVWTACKLGNIDKHLLIIPVTSVQGLVGASFINRRNNIVFTNTSVTVNEAGRITMASLPPPVEITNHGKATAEILFGEGQPLAGKPVIPSLIQMAQVTFKAIEALETFYFG